MCRHLANGLKENVVCLLRMKSVGGVWRRLPLAGTTVAMVFGAATVDLVWAAPFGAREAIVPLAVLVCVARTVFIGTI